jgi:hypothetical protein
MASSIISQEYWPTKGDVKLFVYRKFKDTPKNKPVLVLIHGSSLCALPSYDVRVPGRESEYSMMDICAERGYDVWTIDHEGYGRSDRTSANSNVAMAVGDIGAMLPHPSGGNPPVKLSLLRPIIRRTSRRRVRAGASGECRPARSRCIRLDRRRFGHTEEARRGFGRIPRQQHAEVGAQQSGRHFSSRHARYGR